MPERSDEDKNREQQAYLAYLNAGVTASAKMADGVLETAATALKSIILINGASAVALLTFFGNAWGKGNINTSLPIIANGLQLFGYGVFSGAASLGFRCLSQICYSYNQNKVYETVFASWGEPNHKPILKTWWKRAGDFCQIVAIIAGLFSLVFFVWGMNETVSALKCLK